MKRAVVAVCLLLVSCAGNAARNNALLPSIRLAWPGVRADAVLGAALSQDLATADTALGTGDVVLVATAPWRPILEAADRGIAARMTSREIGPGVAVSLRERATQFSSALQSFTNQR